MKDLNEYEESEKLIYLQALISLAHADGIHDAERQYIAIQAQCVGLSLDTMWEVPDLPDRELLRELPDCLRNILFRDLVTLGYIDNDLSETEWKRIEELALLMDYPLEKVVEIECWLQDYWLVLKRGEALFAV
ncbi:MAG: hypothetical protein KKF24_03480 [Gammaproteobacteria bacterium]|nr:hypothetical protein [Gammaproteobacteria bacterium]MBU1831736.1 hypothetical protein [Gammaproteobacteria bacterium]